MKSTLTEKSITVRASFSSYLVLSGVWVALAVGYFLLSLKNPSGGMEKGTIVAGGVALLWWWWLLGFKITVTRSFLEYRNGFFKSSRIALLDIEQLKDSSIEWGILSRRIRVPRLIVMSRGENADISINPKPFSRTDLKKVRQIIAIWRG